MRYRGNYAVSEVIGTILILMIATSAIAVITFWGVPYMNQKQAEGRVDSALAQFNAMNDIIKNDVIKQGFIGGTEGSSAVVSFKTDSGEISLNEKSERFVFYYSLDKDVDFDVFNLGDTNDNNFSFAVNTGQVRCLKIYLIADEPGGSTAPEEIHGTFPPLNPPITIPTTNSLENAVRIDVYEDDSPPKTIVGRIWLFDTGSISYKTFSGSDVYKLISENSGVVSAINNNNYLSSKPDIIKDDVKRIFLMNMIQYIPSSLISGSGNAKYQITIKLIKYEALNGVNGDALPGGKSFKMQVFGDGEKAWRNYFKIYQGFTDIAGNADNTIKSVGPWTFTLTQSICDLSMKVGE